MNTGCQICGQTPIMARQMCNSHYKRWWRYGDPLASAPKESTEDKFHRSYIVTDDGCWEWTRGVQSGGYAMLHDDGRNVLAHRWAYEHFIGPIPTGFHIDHLCRNRRCVNHQHLEAVTPNENNRRGLGYWRVNGMRDTCKHGHPATPENTYVTPGNPRDVRCRECSRERDKQPHRKNRKNVKKESE